MYSRHIDQALDRYRAKIRYAEQAEEKGAQYIRRATKVLNKK